MREDLSLKLRGIISVIILLIGILVAWAEYREGSVAAWLRSFDFEGDPTPLDLNIQ